MKTREIKIGDRVEVIYQSDYMFPEVGSKGTVISLINGYPKIKFDEPNPYIEDLQGLITVDSISVKVIKKV